MRKTKKIAYTLIAVAAIATVAALAAEKVNTLMEPRTIILKSNGEAVATVTFLKRGGTVMLKSDNVILFDTTKNRTLLSKGSTVTYNQENQPLFQIKADEIEIEVTTLAAAK